MAQQFFPIGDQEFQAWLSGTFLPGLPAVMTALGLPATFDDNLVALSGTYTTSLSSHQAAQTASFEAKVQKDKDKGDAIEELRNLYGQLRGNPNFTAAHRASLGLPAVDTTPTPSTPGSEAPSAAVDTSFPQRHSISFWQTTEEAGQIIAKPSWARAARIVHKIVATGQPAPPIEDMDYLATDTSTPYTWDIPGSEVGKDIWYRLAWETSRGEIGPWSDPAKGTVTG